MKNLTDLTFFNIKNDYKKPFFDSYMCRKYFFEKRNNLKWNAYGDIQKMILRNLLCLKKADKGDIITQK